MEESTTETRVGGHGVRIEPPDLIMMICRGDLSADEIRAMRHWLRRVTEESGPQLIVADFGALGDVPADARKAATGSGEWIPYKAMAICRAGFQARVFMHILIAAMKILSGGALGPIRFFDTELEARAWLQEIRRGG